MRAIVFLCALFACAAAQAGTKVFILAGQSNMDGRGRKADLKGDLAKWAKPQKDVRIAYSNSTIRGPFATDGLVPLAPGYSVAPGAKRDTFKLPSATFGPEVSFGRTIADTLPKDNIVLIKFSEGGTSLHKDWKLDKRGGLYAQCNDFVHQSLQRLTDGGEDFDLAGIVWLQGESDASLPAGEYQRLLTGLIERMRKDLKQPEIPFVIAEVFDNGKRDKVRAGELATSKALPNVLFVSSSGLNTSDGGTHFDAASQIEFGKRLANAWLERGKSQPAAAQNAKQ